MPLLPRVWSGDRALLGRRVTRSQIRTGEIPDDVSRQIREVYGQQDLQVLQPKVASRGETHGLTRDGGLGQIPRPSAVAERLGARC